jgi:hypothetical protein
MRDRSLQKASSADKTQEEILPALVDPTRDW